MRRLIAAVVSALALAAGLVVAPSPPTAQASSTAYTYVQHVNRGVNHGIRVKCHTNGVWFTLQIGDHSDQACGQNGWVDSIWVDAGYWLTVRNIATGNYTQYGNGYRGPIGGGYYDAWVVIFPRAAAVHLP